MAVTLNRMHMTMLYNSLLLLKLLINRFTSMTACLVQTLSMTPLNYNPSYNVYFLKVASYSGNGTEVNHLYWNTFPQS